MFFHAYLASTLTMFHPSVGLQLRQFVKIRLLLTIRLILLMDLVESSVLIATATFTATHLTVTIFTPASKMTKDMKSSTFSLVLPAWFLMIRL